MDWSDYITITIPTMAFNSGQTRYVIFQECTFTWYPADYLGATMLSNLRRVVSFFTIIAWAMILYNFVINNDISSGSEVDEE